MNDVEYCPFCGSDNIRNKPSAFKCKCEACDKEFDVGEDIDTELAELERLTEIGRAVEMATNIGVDWAFDESTTSYTYPSEEDKSSPGFMEQDITNMNK